MKRIYDETLINHYKKKYEIEKMFIQCPKLSLYMFEKGERWNTFLNPKEYMSFLVKGRIHLENIRYDGSIFAVHHIAAFTIIGDLEFSNQNNKQFSIVSDSTCYVLAFPLLQYQPIVEKIYILGYLLRSVGK